MVIGIIAVVFSTVCVFSSGPLFGGPGGVIAVVLGYLGLRRESAIRAAGGRSMRGRIGLAGRGQAITGVVTGAISVVLGVLYVGFVAYLVWYDNHYGTS